MINRDVVTWILAACVAFGSAVTSDVHAADGAKKAPDSAKNAPDSAKNVPGAAKKTPARSATDTKLDRGEIIIRNRAVKGSELPRAIMMGVINVPPAKVWRFLSNCNNYKGNFPRTKSSKELSRKGNTVICKVVVDMPWPMDDLWSTTRATHTVRPGFFKRQWQLVEGTYKKNAGSWTVTPFDKAGKRSRVVYKMHAEPTTSVPKWIQRKASKSTLPDLMNALRKAVGHKPKAG